VEGTAHKAVLAAAHAVVHLGGEEEILPVHPDGQLDLAALDGALTRKPSIVSVMWVNNETGALQDIVTIGRKCEAAGATFHTDAVQAFGKVAFAFRELPAAMLTISGHKVGAPKGIAALIVRDRQVTEAIIHGGGQQFGIRPGTENVAGAVALGRAAKMAAAAQGDESRTLGGLRDDLWARLAAAVPDLVRHVGDAPHAPHILSLSVPGADSEALLMHLDLAGVCASSGSACTTGSVEPSHVMQAMGVPRDIALGALRFSLGHETTAADIVRVAEVFPQVVAKVRKLSVVLGRA
jgi:cysteine desulfurase